MKLVETSITLGELRSMAEARFGDLVKAVVDVRRGIMVVDAELHSDEEALLLESGSEQADSLGDQPLSRLAGVRVDRIRFHDQHPSLQGNRSRGVDDPEIRAQIVAVVGSLVRE